MESNSRHTWNILLFGVGVWIFHVPFAHTYFRLFGDAAPPWVVFLAGYYSVPPSHVCANSVAATAHTRNPWFSTGVHSDVSCWFYLVENTLAIAAVSLCILCLLDVLGIFAQSVVFDG